MLLFAPLYFLLLTGVVGELKWDFGNSFGCSFIFGQSVRERSRQDQHDPLLIWLGAPSEALQVASKHGRLPVISLWRSYVNVLYFTGCEGEQSKQTQLGSFLDHWLVSSPISRDRSLYISGVDQSLADNGGSFLVAVTKFIISRGLNVAGVFIGKPPFSPSIRFFGHRPFETGNKMNEYAVSRAFNLVTCNGWHSQVEFMMDDVLFYYGPEGDTNPEKHSDGSGEMHDYVLKSVSSFDTCYTDMTTFEDEWMRRPQYLDLVFPSLPRANEDGGLSSVFPKCDSTAMPLDYLSLLSLNVTVFMYSFIRQESKPICSFYIGIFEADGMRFPDINIEADTSEQAAISLFNLATTYDIEDSWTRYVDEDNVRDKDAFARLGQIQDGASLDSASGEMEHAKLVWMHLDSRMDLKRKTGLLMLSKMTAVDILSRLMDRNVGVEYVDLFI